MRLPLLTLASLLLIGATPALAADTGFVEPLPQIEGAKDDGSVRPSTADTTSKRSRKTEALGPSEMIPPPTPLSKVLIVDQQRVHMLEAGWDQYEVLILLPGFPDPVVGCQKMMDALAERFHVMAVDPQGFGFSGGPNWVTYSPQGMAQFVLRLMDFLSIEKAHIAGFDLSAATAIRFAYDYPERVHSLVIGAGPVYPEGYTGLIADAQVPISGDQVFSRLLPRMKKYLEEGMHEADRYDEQLAEDLYTFYKDRQTRQYLRDWINTTGTDLYKMQKWYERVEVPTFIVWGASDPYFPVAQADQLVHAFPDARLKVIQDAGHFLLLEQPREVAVSMVQHVYEPPPPPPPFSGLSFVAYRGQSSDRFFVLNNNLEKKVEVTCTFDGVWTDEAGKTVESANVDIHPDFTDDEAEPFIIEPAETGEVSLNLTTVDRNLAVETIYTSELVCTARERREEIELATLPLRLIIPQLGEPMPEAFAAKPIDQPFEMEVGEPPMDELISIE